MLGACAAVVLAGMMLGSPRDGAAQAQTPPQGAGGPAGHGQAPLEFTGAMPDSAGTPCPDEVDPARHLVVPPHITLPGTSAAQFVQRNGHPFGVVVLALRLDGGVGIAFPPVESFDDGMRAVLTGFTKFIGVVPPVPGCLHPAGIVLLRFTVPDGAVTVVPIPPPSGGTPSATPAAR